MTASAASQKQIFHSLLAAPGKWPEIPEENDVYGWLVGSWDLEVLHYAAVDVASLHIQGEVHFGWVLEGRAIQDVWIMPRVSERNANLAGASKTSNNMYGTTLRIWDASIQAWRIRWINPVTNHYEQQNRPPRRQRHCASRRSPGRHSHPLAIHRNHAKLIPLARRSPERRRRHMEARRRISRHPHPVKSSTNEQT